MTSPPVERGPNQADDHPPTDDVIDLRDAAAEPEARRPVSGRPGDLLPGHVLKTITGGDRFTEAEAFVYDIYRQVGYCAESPHGRVEELTRWNDRSRFHAVIDGGGHGEIIGVVRTIPGAYDQLPVGQFTRLDHTHSDPVCELSSLTVRGDVRSTGVIEHLYRAGWLEAYRSDATAIVALIDEWLYDLFQGTYRLPFAVIGEAMGYMGTHPMPVAMPLVGSAYDITADQNPAFWAWTLEAVSADERRRWQLPQIEGGSAQATTAPPTPRPAKESHGP